MAQPRRKGNYGKRPRKTIKISSDVEKEIGTDVVLKGGETLDTLGTNIKTTICSNSVSGSLFDFDLMTESQIMKKSFGDTYEYQYGLYCKNPQDFFDDAFLQSVLLLPKGYVSRKWGFAYGKDEKFDGRSRYNWVSKNITTASGGRIDYSTPKIRSKGGKHYTGKDKLIEEETDRQQDKLATQLPNNDNRRKIGSYSSWLNDLLFDIKAIESKFEYLDEKDNKIKVNRKKVKLNLPDLLNYEKYKEHKPKLEEIIKNYKADFSEPMELMK